jgi:hypothetical protein
MLVFQNSSLEVAKRTVKLSMYSTIHRTMKTFGGVRVVNIGTIWTFSASRPGRFNRGKELPVRTESQEPVGTRRRGKADSASAVMEPWSLQ